MTPKFFGSALVVFFVSALTGCGPRDAPTGPSSRVDARVVAALAAHGAGLPPAFGTDARFERTGRFPVYVRLNRGSTAPNLAGVEWLNGARAIASGAFLARVDAAGLAALDADPDVIRVESGIEMDVPLLDVAAEDVGVTPLRREALAANGIQLDGSGRLVADIDSDAFVFHPGLFRADAGAYAWIDVDGDGSFAPGVDAIDFDADGSATPEERALPLLIEKVDLLQKPFETHTDFRPDEDFLFLDANHNGVRDFGDGFDETTPAYGEPVFVADDANENGVLDPSERVLRLGTSIFARIRDQQGNEFVRGSDQNGIIDYGREVLADPDVLASSVHGTMMTGILAGGPFPGHRYAGIAPGADVLLGAGKARGESISWALQFAPDAISMPFGQTIFAPLDGSSELEQLVDSVMMSGSIPVTSAGNSAPNDMHAETTWPVGNSSLSLSSSYPSAGLYLSVLFRRPVDALSLSITLPDGTNVDMPAGSTANLSSIGGDRYLGYVDTVSSRGTQQRHIELYAKSKLPAGTYTLNVTLTDPEPLDVWLYASNDYLSGFTFDEHTATSGTVSSPATADEALSVAGYAIHASSDYGVTLEPGQLANFSARGPRIDGFHPLDLAAPVNPLSTAVVGDHPDSATYEIWPGTSCSAPMVAGAVALLRQLFPDESAESIRQRIVSGARKDSFVTSDVDAWGQGKLDVAKAAGIEPSSGAAPSLRLDVPERIELGQTFVARVVVTDAGPASSHRTRWDVGYDGTFDTDWLDNDETAIDAKQLGPLALRAETYDDDGYIAGATAVVDVVPSAPQPAVTRRSDAGDTASCSATAHRRGTNAAGWFALAIAAMGLWVRPLRSPAGRGRSSAGPPGS